MKRFFEGVLPNMLMSLSLVMLTFAILHVYNPMMGLLSGGYSVTVLMIFAVLVFAFSVYIYAEYRKGKRK